MYHPYNLLISEGHEIIYMNITLISLVGPIHLPQRLQHPPRRKQPAHHPIHTPPVCGYDVQEYPPVRSHGGEFRVGERWKPVGTGPKEFINLRRTRCPTFRTISGTFPGNAS